MFDDPCISRCKGTRRNEGEKVSLNMSVMSMSSASASRQDMTGMEVGRAIAGVFGGAIYGDSGA